MTAVEMTDLQLAKALMILRAEVESKQKQLMAIKQEIVRRENEAATDKPDNKPE